MAEQQKSDLDRLRDHVYSLKDDWPEIIKGKNESLNFEAEYDWTMLACTKSDTALKYAIGNPGSVTMALRNVGYIGLTLDPAQKFAYVMPRDGAMVYDVSYMGLMEIAIRAGSIVWAQAQTVHRNDTFKLHGYDRPPSHEYDPFDDDEARGDLRGAYVVVKLPGGDYLTNAMKIAAINAIRDRSPAWKNGSVGKKGPWESDPAEMQKKTVVKNGYKYWPRSEALDRAIHYLNTDGGQGIDLAPDADKASRLKVWLPQVAQAKGGTELQTVWTQGRAIFREADDAEGLGEFRAAVEARQKALGVAPTSTPAPPPANAPTATPAPTPAPPAAPKTFAEVVDALKLIKKAVSWDAGNVIFDQCGTAIDALPQDQQGELNAGYNEALEAHKKRFKVQD